MADKKTTKIKQPKRASGTSYEAAAQEFADATAASNALPMLPTPSDEELIVQHNAAVVAELREEIAEQFKKDRATLDKRLAKAEKGMARFAKREEEAVPA